MDINTRIDRLRSAMKSKGIDAYIIPSNDPHQSEYVADYWGGLVWISGFTGSAGTVVITQDHAGLWTDSRYFIQAEEELASSEMVLHKLSPDRRPLHIEWLKEALSANAVVGMDGQCCSHAQHLGLERALDGRTLNLKHDLFNEIWEDRPTLPTAPIFEHELRYTGQSRAEKLAVIRKKMTQKGASHHLIVALDDIAWTFNLRGKDVDCNPVAIAYAVLEDNVAYLFINEDKVPLTFKQQLATENIHLKDYFDIKNYLQNLPKGSSILLSPSETASDLMAAIPENTQIIKSESIAMRLKAIKNNTEIAHIRGTMVKDGVALLKLYRWLEVAVQKRGVKETEVAEKLAAFRAEQALYFGESFPAIVGWKGNGAIVHYHAEAATCATIEGDGILLLDSGGQYQDGTTDTTRTTVFGAASMQQKRDYTLVLKGNIGLSMLQFPEGTRGNQMEILARQHLWQHGLNYGHGTGHGVGFFLNVHEGPQSIGPGATARAAEAIELGMLTSNEPGFYKEGEYGIRIENLVLTIEKEATPYGKFYGFETMTLFPIDTNLIQVDLLTLTEKSWLNDYHSKVLDRLEPSLNKEEYAWLEEKCKAI